jgi:hypothetical protein
MAENDLELSDDKLVAYADKELTEEEMIRLKPLIEADIGATEKVEEFRRSADQLREYFSVDTPVVTPVEIAQKIRGMSRPQASSDKIVSLTSYRQRLSRGVRSLAAGAGLQKIAASLIVGAFIGVGGAEQFTGSNGDSELKFRGAPINVSLEANGLVLKSADGTFHSGSTISKSDGYRIHLKTDGADKVWLIYHENNDAPEFLLKDKLTGSAEVIKVPTDQQKGIKIDTEALFVTFEVQMQHQGRVTRKFYVFGVK